VALGRAGSVLQLGACGLALVVSILLMVFGFATLFVHATVATHVVGVAVLIVGFVVFQVAIRVAIRAIRGLR
jgi:uncharacterized membrane protein YqaE (UPF0057 family)